MITETINKVFGEKYTNKAFIGDMIFSIVCLILTIFMFFTSAFWIETREVSGSSMQNTFNANLEEDNDIIIVDKLKEIEFLDVVVFHANSKSDYIKRVIGMPGDVVYSIQGYVYIEKQIDGQIVTKKLDETYTKVQGSTYCRNTSDIPRTIVGDDEYFVLGDNRVVSNDSRYIGCIKKEQMVGVVTKFAIDNKGITTKIFSFIKKIFKNINYGVSED